MEQIPIGRLLRSSITGCVVGCTLSQATAPAFGQMVLIPLDDKTRVFGLIYDIHVDDDGLVRQLVTASNISPAVIEDNRVNRNVPLEISVVFVGCEIDGRINHLLPPRPPLTLDSIYPCSAADLARFTADGRFAYLRHLLRNQELPAAEVLAIHLREVIAANPEAAEAAVQTVIAMLKDDYAQLMDVLSAVSEVYQA
jgi:hypothetical protein